MAQLIIQKESSFLGLMLTCAVAMTRQVFGGGVVGVRARSTKDHQTLPQNQEGKLLPCKRGGKTTDFLPSSSKHLWIRGREVDQVWSCRGPWAPFLFLRLPSFQVSAPHPCASVLVLLSGRFKREHSMSPQPLRPEVAMLKDWQKDSERGGLGLRSCA